MARLAPRPDAPASVRRVPASRSVAAAVSPSLVSPPLMSAPVISAPPVAGAPAAAPPATREPALGATIAPPPVPHAAVTPLSPERYKLQVTISGETLEKMRLAKDTLSHAVPTGDDAAILARAFDALLEKLAKQKFAATDQPRVSPDDEERNPGPHRRGQARRLGPRPRALPLHRSERPSLRGAPLRRVPPYGPARAWRRGERRPDRAALPPPQRLRREAVFRDAPQATRTRSGTS